MSRIEKVALHLRSRGHISAGSALTEYGLFRLSDVIHRLRHERPDLLPEGMEIVTIEKHDTKGAKYGEYHLVSKRSAAARRRLASAAGAHPPAAL